MVKEIQVTKEHIMEGEPAAASYCAIACAIADEYGLSNGSNAMVCVNGHKDVFFDYGDYFVELIVEPCDIATVREFIEDFDYIEHLEEINPINDECLTEYKANLKEFTFRYTERNS